MKKRILTSLVLCVCLVCTTAQTVFATSTQSLLDDVNEDIDALEDEQQEAESELSDLQYEMAELMAEIDSLAVDLEVKSGQIEQAELDLEDAQERQAQQYEDMKVRIRYMYENDTKSMIQVALESDSFAEMLNKIRYIQQVYEYDRQLLAEYEETTQQVAELKADLEAEYAELVAMEEEYHAQKEDLDAMISTLKATVSNYEEKLAEARSLAAQYEAQIEAEKEAARIAAEEAARKAAEEEAARQAAQNQSSSNSGSSNSSSSNSSSSNSGSSSGGEANGDSLTTDTTAKNVSAGLYAGLNPAQTTGVDGSEVVAYARQFIGNRYVWGGTDPYTGADCSGFVQYCLGQFGVWIPRTSAVQARYGQEVSLEYAQPGDLVFYAWADGTVHHVAMYAGDGMIVHARSETYGICENSATYATIYCIRRMI